MKILKYIVILFLFSNCTAQSKLSNVAIDYSATTRGTMIEVKITSKEIRYKKNETTKLISLVSIQRKELGNLLEKIPLEKLHTFISPTSGSHSDRSLQASLKIIKNEKVYTSQIFDHGNPPKELKAFLEYVFRIIEKR